jgi:hypothetical protein
MVGEHIRALKRGRWSHAIDCGDETVIHLAEDDATRSVRRSYRPEFISGADVVEVVTHRQRTFPADEVVARAYSRIADPALAGMFASSESFAHWCTTGRPSPPPQPDTSRAADTAHAAAAAKTPRSARAPVAAKARTGKRAKATGARRSRAAKRTNATGTRRSRAAPQKPKPRKPRRPAPKRR